MVLRRTSENVLTPAACLSLSFLMIFLSIMLLAVFSMMLGPSSPSTNGLAASSDSRVQISSRASLGGRWLRMQVMVMVEGGSYRLVTSLAFIHSRIGPAA